MPFDWRDFLGLARFLQQATETHPPTSAEARLRTAVSRAYFAAYAISARAAEKRYGFSPTGKAEDHRLLRECLKRHKRTDLARGLDQLRQLRNCCDYNNRVEGLEQMAEEALAYAQDIIERVE